MPDYSEAVRITVEMSKMIPKEKYIGWDLAHTKNGWVVIEGNASSQLIGPQIVFRRGIRKEVAGIVRQSRGFFNCL